MNSRHETSIINKLVQLRDKSHKVGGMRYWQEFLELRSIYNKGKRGCYWYLGDISKQPHLYQRTTTLNGDKQCIACYKIQKVKSV